MSEVDRLSNSGLYPALPIADRRTSRDGKERRRDSEPTPDNSVPASSDAQEPSANPRPPKSLIDEYA
jgi:hypothetical protein